jgi:hypothetical protein
VKLSNLMRASIMLLMNAQEEVLTRAGHGTGDTGSSAGTGQHERWWPIRCGWIRGTWRRWCMPSAVRRESGSGLPSFYPIFRFTSLLVFHLLEARGLCAVRPRPAYRNVIADESYRAVMARPSSSAASSSRFAGDNE